MLVQEASLKSCILRDPSCMALWKSGITGGGGKTGGRPGFLERVGEGSRAHGDMRGGEGVLLALSWQILAIMHLSKPTK